MIVCITEDVGYRHLYPLTKTRPSFGLRCGRYTIEERIIYLLDPYLERVHYLMRPELRNVWKQRHSASTCVDFDIPEEKNCLFLNGRVLFDEESLRTITELTQTKKPFIWMNRGTWVAFYHPDKAVGLTLRELQSGKTGTLKIRNRHSVNIPVITSPWDLVRYNSRMIHKDFLFIKNRLRRLRFSTLPEKVHVTGSRNLIVGNDVTIHSGVTIDATNGPVIIGDNVHIESGVTICGPVSVGRGCHILANAILCNSTTLGKNCLTGGKISQSVFQGYARKKNTRILANSYLGEWVQIGAESFDRRLKKSENIVSTRINGSRIESNDQYMGLFMGDYSQSADGTLFNAATSIGIGCHVYGAGTPPRVINDFTYGGIEAREIYDFHKFLEAVNLMMTKQKMELNRAEILLLSYLYQSRVDMEHSVSQLE